MPSHSPADKIRKFLDERQAQPPADPSSTDKLNEFISRQGAASDEVEETGGPGIISGIGRKLKGIGKRLLQPPINVPVVTPAIQRGLDIGSRPLEAFAESTFRTLALKDPVNVEESLNPLDVIRQGAEAFRERPFLQQLGIGLLDPTVALARAPSALGTVTRAVPADPFLRAATPATQRIGETLGTRGTTGAVSRMRLAQTGQRAAPGFAPGDLPSAVQQPTPLKVTDPRTGQPTTVQALDQAISEADDALVIGKAAGDDMAELFAAGSQNQLREARKLATPDITPPTQRAGGQTLSAEIKATQEARTSSFTKGPTGTGGGTPPPARIASAGPPEADPSVHKVIKAIRGAQRLGPEKEELIGTARTQRFARGMGAQRGLPATERAGAFFRQQAGPIDRPDITKLQIEFGPGEYEGLVERIYSSSRLREGTFDPFTAAEAFKKLFNPVGGTLPQPHELELLERVFGPEFAKAILSQRSLGAKAWDNFLSAWNLPRAFMATGDLSATLRQAAPLGVNNKRIYREAFKQQVRAFLSEKAALEAQDVIESHPRFLEYTKKPGVKDPRKSRRLDLTTFSASGSFARREESFMSKWSQNLPIVRNAERAYVTMLNKLRFEVMDDMVVQAEKNLGKNINEKELDSIASFINYATGRGPLGPAEAAAPLLNGMFFAPRFATSRFALPGKVALETARGFTGVGGATNRATSLRMARDMALFVGTGMSVLMLAKLGGSETSADPRSSDFGKMILGKTRIDIWGGFQQVARLTAQMITGQGVSTTTGEVFPLSSEFIFGAAREGLEAVNVKREIPSRGAALLRFVRGKLGPIVGEATDQLTGEDFLGDEATPSRFTEASLKNPFFENLVPLFVQDLIDAILEEGLASGLKAVPSFFGAGSVTYTSDLDKAAETNFDLPFRELNEREQEIVRESLRKVRREKQLEKVRQNQP